MNSIQTALQSGAVLTAQFATSTSFTLHMSWPMQNGVPFLSTESKSLEAAFVGLDELVAAREEAQEELGE